MNLIYRVIFFGLLIYVSSFYFKCTTERKDKESRNTELFKYRIEVATMQYAVVSSQKKKLILFIHGSPGSWDAFSKYLEDRELQSESILVSVDRHGYGGSMRGLPELSIGNQARYIKPILDKYNLPTIVLGHSYGGPVALRLAMDYPERIKHVLLLAPSIDPELEEVRWYQRVANWKLIRFILPGAIDVCNQEILPAKFELEKMEHLWKSLKTPMTVIQGDNDSLVPPGNADYAERMYPDKSKLKIIRGDMNHFLPWNQYELVKKEVLEIVRGIE
jgi:pimeloyl-ACP methyl ester carboxylesterase